jgi:hypothetical protein
MGRKVPCAFFSHSREDICEKEPILKIIGIIISVTAVILSFPCRLYISPFTAGAAELRFSGFIPMITGLMFVFKPVKITLLSNKSGTATYWTDVLELT